MLRHQLVAENSSLDFNDTNYVDFGDLTWNKYEGAFFVDSVPVASTTNYKRVICTKYKTLDYNLTEDKTVRVSYKGTRIVVYDSSFADATTEQFKNANKGVLLAYEKASS